MVVISGKWYVAPVELNGTILIPIFLFILFISIAKQLKNKNFSWKRSFLIIIFLIYFWVLLDVTLFPIPLFSQSSVPYKLGFGKQVFINLKLSVLQTYMLLQLIGNLILLVPLSFFVAIFKEKYERILPNIGLMFLSSLSIESLQLLLSYFYLGNRTFDVNDLLLNTLGSILGFVAFKLLNLMFKPEIEDVRIN
ncbi:VanZ family protein [Lactobacillus sp. ESL0684]|uniref:VanZ family protein n=1 Tax=Lactobacillus sp. ESL0684 TaxID=2983213 RepID=UPI0023F92AA0|nr:VanZ family protein [Lactobacillus sp. ESL0684]WEV43158.1 VanZ family protein [Lactobacillus sp. ESL0684]